MTSILSLFAAGCTKPTFFGLVPWYQYLELAKDSTEQCVVRNFVIFPVGGTKSDVPLVLLALVDNALRLAGLIAIGFIIYGGVQYVTSQGKPDAAAKAQSTIVNALVGLVVALIAVGIVAFIGNRVG